MELKSKREAVIDVVTRLFIYTDLRQWDKIQKEVFTEKVRFDMSSAGAGEPKELTAKAICTMWEDGFVGIDQVHHQAGNFLVEFKEEDVEANVFCYAIAIHYKEAAMQGKTREFVGSYDLHANFTDLGWRIDSFKYNLKYINGNKELK
jgi:hypothetical protein